MDKAIELTYELKEELNSLPLFQEYKRIKHLVDTSSELKEMKEEIARTNDKSKKDKLLKEYKSHPLMVNYDALEKEVSEYLLEICEIINKK